jgi:hypothetical protein
LLGIVYIKHHQKRLLAMMKDVVVTFLPFLTDEESNGQCEDSTNMNINGDRDGSVQTKRDSNARKGKRSTPPTINDKDFPESTLEDIDSDRDVADTGKDGGLRQSGRI